MNGSSKELINDYMSALLKVNKHINLTRIEEGEAARLLHIEDSLSGLSELNDAPQGDYVDLGSGGGFPGVPLALASGRQTLLVDSVKKKMAAVSSILKDLDLTDQISTYDGRIEELSSLKNQCFSVATARALAQLSVLMELASPLLRIHGRLICFKAQVSEEEYSHALKLQSYLGMKLVSDRSFVLSDGMTHRRIIVFEKVKQPGLKLPRRIGLAQKKPL